MNSKSLANFFVIYILIINGLIIGWNVAEQTFQITNLPKILLTHPLETCRILEMSQGLAPEWANSTIFCLVESGNGRPPTNTPPSWLTPLWPEIKQSIHIRDVVILSCDSFLFLPWFCLLNPHTLTNCHILYCVSCVIKRIKINNIKKDKQFLSD